MARLSIYFAALFTLATWVKQTEGSGTFQLTIDRLVNERGLDSEGSCCSGEGNGRQRCQKTCQTSFKVCLTHYQYPMRENPTCTFAMRKTPVIGENSFNPQNTEYFQKNPFEKNFAFTWPGSFSLLIDVFHEDPKQQTTMSPDTTRYFSSNSVGSKNIVSLHFHGSVKGGDDWTRKIYRHQDKQLHYSFRVKCDEHYYGIGCSAYCRPKNNRFGHFVCDENGQKVCMEGWTGYEAGLECTKPACKAGCSSEHGYCEKPNECRCRPGWMGPNCTQCISFPGCSHGSCTIPYQCICDPGWGGTFCTLDLNYCTNHKPCKNNAICNNVGEGSYKCVCPEGFEGVNCEIEINECASNPCKNEAKCIDEINGYRCECPPNFFGVNCEKTDLTCADNPCLNGASCSDTDLQFVCTCPENFYGLRCQNVENKCLSNPCLNGGLCTSQNSGYKCECPSGFFGNECQNTDHCTHNPCNNGATCSSLEEGFVCSCLVGFTGPTCDVDVDECADKPCINGGTCRNLRGSFECFCPPGYSGSLCHTLSNKDSSALRNIGGEKKTNIFIVSDKNGSDLTTTQWIVICISAVLVVLFIVVVGGCFAYKRKASYSAGRRISRQADMSLPLPSNDNQLSDVTIVRTKRPLKATKPVPNASKTKLPKTTKLPSLTYAIDTNSSKDRIFASTDSLNHGGPIVKRPKSTSSSSYLTRLSTSSYQQHLRPDRSQSESEQNVHSLYSYNKRRSLDHDQRSDIPLLKPAPSAHLPTYEEACEEHDGLLSIRNARRSVPNKYGDKL